MAWPFNGVEPASQARLDCTVGDRVATPLHRMARSAASNKAASRIFLSCSIGRRRVVGQVDAHPPHPWLRPDAPHPVCEGRDASKVFQNVPFGDQPNRNDAAGAIANRGAKEGLGREATFSMVAQRAMPEISDDDFRPIEPVMY
jgi:hypothetical protein